MENTKKFDEFKLDAKRRGKSLKAKLRFADVVLSGITVDDEVIIVDPEDYYGENRRQQKPCVKSRNIKNII